MKRGGFRIAVFDGDGIGPEVMAPTLEVLRAAVAAAGAPALELEHLPGGAGSYARTGIALPDTALAAAKAADAILLGAMGDPAVRYPDGTEIAPQIDLRFELELYASVRPVKPIAGLGTPLSDPRALDIDFVLVRESTEGLFAARGRGVITADATEAHDTMVISRAGTRRLTRFGLDLAARRKAQGHPGKLTLIDKANIFTSMAFMRSVFNDHAAERRDIVSERMYVDAAALNLVKNPWNFDVMITENMYGDILSDLGAALMGGLGCAPSADIGDNYAVFQPCHGTAPDIRGLGRANPVAMMLSGAMMLEWLGERHGEASASEAGALVRRGIDAAFGSGALRPFEMGGDAGTGRIASEVLEAIQARKAA
ncbi:isocitrate/isopropylmalate dehydrogenase family protein [Tepidamorphus sp. 3E244]|uniref:isocitrate/isopropylmalate dehydrogenase family protein n=1 Tax=Tepidamorphus sp. 3E244 TaxID=3385498 RepID=UPI0038FD0F91